MRIAALGLLLGLNKANDALVAVDHNKDGSFNLGDTLIKLSDISLDTEILVGDIQTYIS